MARNITGPTAYVIALSPSSTFSPFLSQCAFIPPKEKFLRPFQECYYLIFAFLKISKSEIAKV
jgi:hypothetical protein